MHADFHGEVSLRELTLRDSEEIATLCDNRNIWNNLRDYVPYPYGVEDAEVFIRSSIQQDPTVTFAIQYQGQLAGVISLVLQQDVYRHSAETGFWIGEPFWGRGIATRALGQITSYAKTKLGLVRIFAGVFEFNKVSMRVFEKNDYNFEGISKKAVFKNGSFYDEFRFARILQ